MRVRALPAAVLQLTSACTWAKASQSPCCLLRSDSQPQELGSWHVSEPEQEQNDGRHGEDLVTAQAATFREMEGSNPEEIRYKYRAR